MSPLGFLGRLEWFGDDVAAAELLPNLKSLGIRIEKLDTRQRDGVDEFCAGVLFLGSRGNPRLDSMVRRVVAVLNRCRNVIVVQPKAITEVPRVKELERRLAKLGLRFSTYREGGSDYEQQVIDDLPLRGGELRQVGFSAREIVNAVFPLQHPVSNRHLKDRDIFGEGLNEVRGLLRRSFQDCTSIRVTSLHGGRKAESVWCVVASKGSDYLQPFVAKVASRSEIFSEIRRFSLVARDQLPFPSRPNYLADRSIVVGLRGMLVGQLVERAVPLDTAVRHDGAEDALHELFSRVLHRWWANSFRGNGVIQTTFETVSPWRPSENDALHRRPFVLEERRRKSRELGWPDLPADGVRKRLHEARQMRMGRIHADLNCGNVLVRGRSPVVIDFEKCTERGPLLADPVWLEVNLVFGTPWGDDESNASSGLAEWCEAVRVLYDPRWFLEPMPLDIGEEYSDPIHRLCAAVRTIRRHSFAASMGDGEYKDIAAAALLRISAFEDDTESSSIQDQYAIQRAVAYGVACNLVLGKGAPSV